MIAFRDPDVAAVFDSYPPAIRKRLLQLRALIFATAAKTEGVGALEETLKWGQPSYLTSASKSGSTIRIDAVKGEASRYAAYFICRTNLVDRFRELYSGRLTFDGNRAILLDAREKLPEPELRHCIAQALTYKKAKR